tara:strand:+ start:274 stop:396 length:123 start_codon:yes stop_codon:yes gene_type:complete
MGEKSGINSSQAVLKIIIIGLSTNNLNEGLESIDQLKNSN